jgi:DDE superfamily endonuclease
MAAKAILGRRDWDADALRDIVRDYVIEHLADDDAVLVIDETGFLKQGKASCGVARQYTGSAGRITNCQIGVFATYVSCHGHAFIDRVFAKSTHGNDNETPPAPVSTGCSQPTKLAQKWAAPIPSHPKSHNHCGEVPAPNLVKAAVEGRLPRGIGVERLRDLPTEWNQQFEALRLTPE